MKKTILVFILLTTSLFAQKGEYGFTINGGLNFPGGDFSSYYHASFGGSGSIFYNFSEIGRVSATVGYNSWSLDLNALNEDVKKNGNTGSYNIEAPINAIPFLLNVKFFLKTELSFTPYIMLEGGVYNITREVYGKYIDENGISHKVTPKSDITTDGSLNLGFGIEYPINELINFDINARYHYLLNKDTYNLGDVGYGSSYSTINFISVFVGLNIFFK